MKKYLIGLIIVCSFFIFDLSVAQATKCCCYLKVADADRESFAVTKDSTSLIDATSETECINSCFNTFTNEYRQSPERLFVDYYNRYTWDLIAEASINKDLCFTRFPNSKSKTEVDYKEYRGCAVFNTTIPQRLIYIASPNNFSKYDKEVIVEGVLNIDSELSNSLKENLQKAQSFSEVSSIWAAYLKMVTYNHAENYPMVEQANYLYDSLLEFEPTQSCNDAYSYVRGDFAMFPQKDSLQMILPAEITVTNNEVSINNDQQIQLTASSNFENVGVETAFTWETSSSSVVSISSNNGKTITITGGLSGGALISVKSSWGGQASITVKNLGIGMSDIVAKIKNKCLELSETSNNIEDLRNSCNEISATTAEAAALLKCKEAAAAFDDQTKIAEREAQCDELKAEAPKIGGEEGKGTALYNDMVAQIQKFSSSGLVGTGKSVPLIIGELLKYVFGIIGSVAFAIFVYGGLSYMFSGGDKKKVTEAKDTFLWAILGLAAIFLSYSVLNFIISKL